MRSLFGVALFATAVIVAAAPAGAQVSSPGPVYYNQSGAPIPGAPYAPPHGPQVNTGGPVYAGPQGGPQGPTGPQVQNGQVWQNGRWVSLPAPSHPNGARGGNRWGGNVGGRWWGGSQAPGGWGGYHRPRRGGRLDPYWLQPDFQIPDYLSFGLAAPPYGTFWVRYYDDAVLIDAQGSVQSYVSGIAWASASASSGNGYASSSASASAGGYGQGGQIGYVDPDPAYYSGPQGGYAPPAPYGQPAVQYGCPNTCPPQVIYQGGGYQQQGYGQQSYYSGGGGGYYGGGSTTTTVVIQSPPVITTTIVEEEIVTEEVVSTSYVRSAPRRVYRAPARHRPKPRPRRSCSCQCCR